MRATDEPTHADVVASIYRAFETGRTAHILDQLADDVSWDADWTSNSSQRAGIPHMRARRGPAQVSEFLALLADWSFQEFSVLDIIGTGRQVVAEVQIDVVLSNGGRIVDQELHLWTFGEDGRVSRFRRYTDTAKHIAAAAGSDTHDGGGRVITAFVLGYPGTDRS